VSEAVARESEIFPSARANRPALVTPLDLARRRDATLVHALEDGDPRSTASNANEKLAMIKNDRPVGKSEKKDASARKVIEYLLNPSWDLIKAMGMALPKNALYLEDLSTADLAKALKAAVVAAQKQ
jgi:hypothetical protein